MEHARINRAINSYFLPPSLRLYHDSFRSVFRWEEEMTFSKWSIEFLFLVDFSFVLSFFLSISFNLVHLIRLASCFIIWTRWMFVSLLVCIVCLAVFGTFLQYILAMSMQIHQSIRVVLPPVHHWCWPNRAVIWWMQSEQWLIPKPRLILPR